MKEGKKRKGRWEAGKRVAWIKTKKDKDDNNETVAVENLDET